MIHCNGLQSKADETMRNTAMGGEKAGDALNRGPRDYQNTLTRPEHRHPDGLAGCIERNSPFGITAQA
jgi:hypothetical protein